MRDPRNYTAFHAVLVVLATLTVTLCMVPTALASEGQCANEQLRVEDNSTALPDCRADELVEPPYTAGSNSAGGFTVASDGEQAIQSFAGGFAGATGGQNEFGAYEFTRTPQGWITTALEPPNSIFPSTDLLGYDEQGFEGANATLTTTLWKLRKQSAAVFSYYLREPRPGSGCPAGATEVEAPLQDACIVEVGPMTLIADTENSGQPGSLARVGTSEDLSTVLFKMRAPTTSSEQDFLWPGDTTKEGDYSLYEYVGTGQSEPQLVGVKNNGPLKGYPHVNEGAELVSKCGTELGSGTDVYNAVSAGGETVFFTAKSGTECPKVNELYARIDGEKTVALSEPPLTVYGRECTGTCETDETTETDRKAAIFQGASQNGSKVFFLTEQPLVNGAVTTTQKKDLYEEEIEGGEVTSLVQVSHDPHAGQLAEVEGVARVSEDGSHVYFVAKGELASNENSNHEKATEDADNLYVYERDASHLAGRLRFIADLCSAKEKSGTVTDPQCPATSTTDTTDWEAADERHVQATPDGEYLVFESVAHLAPGDTASTTKQVYEYDAETGELARVSVGQCPTGAATCQADERYGDDGLAGTAVIPDPAFNESEKATEPQSDLAISDDGADVFFTSTDALAAGALDGVENVYEYQRSDGQNGNVELIEGGTSEEIAGAAVQRSAELKAISGSAEDVFFTTDRSLVGQDTNTTLDIYDARIGGGFPAPAASPPGCEADATDEADDCQGALGAVLGQPPASGSATQKAGENLTTSPAPVVKVTATSKPLTRAQKLAKALKACKQDKKKAKRQACVRHARKEFGQSKKAKK